MIIKPPETIEEFENVEKSLIGLLANPWADEIKSNVEDKLHNVRMKMNEIEPERQVALNWFDDMEMEDRFLALSSWLINQDRDALEIGLDRVTSSEILNIYNYKNNK